jgi:hypothetical protein
LLAVTVDVLDPHRGDHLAELAEDDVLRLLLDLGGVQAQQANGRVLHHLEVGADGHGEDAGHVDTDVLHRQGAFERDLDLDRFQVEVGVILHQRHNEGRPAVDAAGGVAAAHLAVDDQDAVARAALVAAEQQHREAEEDDRGEAGHDPQPGERGVVVGEKNGTKHG